MRKAAVVFLLTIVCAVAALAQGVAGLGAVSGTVRDSSGAVVPGASVVVANESKGIIRNLQTTDAGLFAAPALTPSSGYSIVVAKDGFSKWEAKDFAVAVGQTVAFSVALKIGPTTTTVEVTGEAPLVEAERSGVSHVVSSEQIMNLPINGRRADTFASMAPAVVADGTFGLLSFRGISAGNNFMTDGNNTTNSMYGENAGRTRISTQISQDAVQEFEVLSDGFSAEFGRANGGVINTVTRSGSNSVHGTAYEFFRNRTLNAPDRYSNHFNAPEWRHQAGASLGGPIKSNKLFYFANVEIVKRNFPGMNRFIANSAFTDSAGRFLTPLPCTATTAQCAAAVAFIQKQMDVLVPRTVSSSMGFGKIDYRPSARNSFTFQLNAMHWRSPYGIQTQAVLGNGNMIGGNANSTVETRYGKAAWTFLATPSAVNELRFGWFKDRLSDPASSDLWPSTGALGISLNGAAIGAPSAYPRTYPSEQRFQIVDNYSWTHGAHSVKFGVDYSTTQDWISQLSNWAGSYSYTSLTNFAKDFNAGAGGSVGCGTTTVPLPCYSGFTQTFGNREMDMRSSDINFYAQDTWKATRRLTLNYGIRYEKSFLPQPTITDPNYAATGHIPSPNKNFAPRVSLSYMLNDRTVLRAGYGIYYAPFVGTGIQQLLLGNGKYQTSISVQPNTVGAPIFPNVVPNVNSVPAGTINLTFADQAHFRNPYSQQGTVTLERQIARDLGITASYIWSRGVQIWTSRELNAGAPGPTMTYVINNLAGAQVGAYSTPVWISANKPDTRYGHIWETENGGQSWYSGLALQVKKRMSHGLSAQISYTWSHAIDDANQSGAGGTIYLSQSNTFAGNYMADKGSSGLDQRHRAVVNFMWQPTFTESKSAIARYLINGWELSAITTMASAQPTTATISVSGQQFTGTTMLYTSSLNGSGGWGRVPFWPVNSVDIDRMYRVDARLGRNIPISERVKASLMFEAFNAFNTQYNTGVNSQAYTARNGVLTPTTTLGAGTQSQGFPDGTNARRAQVALRVTF